MSRLGKGIASGFVGLAAVGAGLSLGSAKPEIDPARIEACATALEDATFESSFLPLQCYNGTQEVFDMVDVSGPSEPPQLKPNPISPDEYRRRAYEYKTSIETDTLTPILQKLASVAVGVGLGSLVYYEWAINTAERRTAAEQINTVPTIE